MNFSFLPIVLLLFKLVSYATISDGSTQESYQIEIPLGGNTFQTAGAQPEKISEKRIESWRNIDSEFSIYVHSNQKQTISIALHLDSQSSAIISLSVNGKSEALSFESDSEAIFTKKKFELDKGYNQIILRRVAKKGGDIFLKHKITLLSDKEFDINFVEDNIDNRFYWGRRGPSVHLSYTYPETEDFKWFYNEVTVPNGSDPIGSYYMANGFAEGYFGIQVNSESERRILFSVWSPFKTDNPDEIPKEEQIQLLKKGEGVYSGEFGNEGSGGQSYLVYNWKAGQTYGFLNSVEPDGVGNTVYAAYFMDPDVGEWVLIASFLRPKINTWYKRPHSFLENFAPENGYLMRMAFYDNQWLGDADGNWIELTEAKFTGDDIAKRNFRMDYEGGEGNGGFYLKNGGFFNKKYELNSLHLRISTDKPPVVNLNSLP
jgi:hypothetical protein